MAVFTLTQALTQPSFLHIEVGTRQAPMVPIFRSPRSLASTLPPARPTSSVTNGCSVSSTARRTSARLFSAVGSRIPSTITSAGEGPSSSRQSFASFQFSAKHFARIGSSCLCADCFSASAGGVRPPSSPCSRPRTRLTTSVVVWSCRGRCTQPWASCWDSLPTWCSTV